MDAGSPSTEPAASSDVDAVMEETDEALESGQEERSRGYLVRESLLVWLYYYCAICFYKLTFRLLLAGAAPFKLTRCSSDIFRNVM